MLEAGAAYIFSEDLEVSDVQGRDAELLHDLRVVLQVMRCSAQLLETEIGENEKAMGYIQLLQSGADQMQRMLTGALEPMQPEAGPCRPTRCDLVGQTWEICAKCRLYAQRKNIRLSFHANADRLEMALDEDKYARILMNLLSNALKFTPEGGMVRVIVRALGDFAEVSVEDNGCGIAAERLNAIFELYETDGGYGYGLYIARTYAQLMDGALSVQSEPGRGSTFTLRLPVRSVAAAEMAARAVCMK